jgi:hypothetical protein
MNVTEGNYPAGHLSFIQMPIQKPLTVCLPPIHRHMDAQFVKSFKEHGSLRISSFAAFKRHKSEQQGDVGEGAAFSSINDTENDRSFSTLTVSGENSYALSATMRTGPDVAAVFGNSSFEIFEPVGFCAEVANEIPGCKHAMIGQCVYVDERMLVSSTRAPTVEDLKSEEEPDKISLEKIITASAKATGPKPYFLKTRKYEWQAEYRFIWETNKRVTSYLDIVLPSLHQFCKF